MKRILVVLAAISFISPACKEHDVPELLPAHFGTLVLQHAMVYDNGEGDENCSVAVPWPLSLLFGDIINPCHGPHGSLHVLIFDPEKGCPPARKSYSGYLRHVYLKGPTPKGYKWEWLDGDEKRFDDLALFEWRSENDSVIVFVYESDPSTWMGITVPGRGHDPLFCEEVSRSNTALRRTFKDTARHAERRALENCWKRGVVTGRPCPAMEITVKTVDGAGTSDFLP